jgi:hypothetical protein
MTSKLAVFFAIGNRITIQIRLNAYNGKPLAVWNLDSRLDKTSLVKQGSLFDFDSWIDQIVIPVLTDVKKTWLNHVRIYEVDLYRELDAAISQTMGFVNQKDHPLVRVAELVNNHEKWVWEYDVEQTAAVMQLFATLDFAKGALSGFKGSHLHYAE